MSSTQKFCAYCGNALEDNVKFCAYCGAKVPQPTEHKEENGAEYCPACGFKFRSGDKVCIRCGTARPFSNTYTQNNRNTQTGEAYSGYSNTSEYKSTYQSNGYTNVPGAAQTKAPKKKKGGAAWIFILIALFAVGYFGSQNNWFNGFFSDNDPIFTERDTEGYIQIPEAETNIFKESDSSYYEDTEAETESDRYTETEKRPPVDTEKEKEEDTTSSPPIVKDDVIPSEWKSHQYLNCRDSGYCAKLNGKMLITFVFADDNVSSWNEGDKEEALNELNNEMVALQDEAKRFSSDLEIKYISFTAKISKDAHLGVSFADDVAKSVGYSSAKDMQSSIEKSYNMDSAPIIIVFNKSGRAYAQPQYSEHYAETLVLFSDDISPFRHELFHLYGAKDFYYPNAVYKLAVKYLDGSIMNSGDKTDDLTAFLIGWTDTLSYNAKAFLEETAHYTSEELVEENEKETITGYGTKYYNNGAVYEGDLLAGSPNGKGSITWSDGSSYTGEWDHGERTGKGKITWSNGDYYEGEFRSDVIHGSGTYYWKDGNIYTGAWVNGVRTGYGVYTMASGDRYEGNFQDGNFHGNGTYYWSSGSTYSGAWDNGVRSGYAVYIWPDGARYEGYFLNGSLHGEGTYYYANGSSKSGTWNNGEFVE
ncbi:MAG: zinc-ribbon domain-containing protein [Ruminococcaceae bacterium]|nr:zinc-ribbon domain-containing protein [Oscillospiraceae bacterium]